MEKMRVKMILCGVIILFFTTAKAQSCLNCSNAINSGLNSNALGTNAVASAELSIAFGQNARASNYRAIALGTSAYASGMSSLAIGNLVKSSAYNSISIGMGSSNGYLENSISNSLMVGFNSTLPTFFVGPSTETPAGVGKVGIGTTNPAEMLTVNGTVQSLSGGFRFPDGSLQSSAATTLWGIDQNGISYLNGNVGIGISPASVKLDVYGDLVLGKPGDNFILHSRPWIGDALIIAPQNNFGGWDWSKGFALKDNGQVYIGSELTLASPHQNYKLAVNGKVACKELVVTIQNWADEVFEKDYQLMSLPELEHYIQRYHHLPGIPPKQEVIMNGMEVGEINRSLLTKIEELSLYTIRLNEELSAIKQSLNTHYIK
ncbi:MAG: hypothetical protein WCO63_14250 [Bacteroidota bacterium]